MPEINTPLLLDVLLGLVILLFVPFGIRRGVAKEAFVSAGIFFGAELAERYGSTVGREISDRLGVETRLGEFLGSVAILFAATFVLGYGGGAALGRLRPGPLSRVSGAVLAAFNGGLLLSLLLSWVDTILGQGEALENGFLARELIEDTGRLMLAAGAVLLAMTLFGWIMNAFRTRGQPRSYGDAAPTAPSSRSRTPHGSKIAYDGKLDPVVDPVLPSGRFEPGVDATSPLAPGAFARGADYQTNSRSNGNLHTGQADSVWRRPTMSSRAQDETVWAPWASSELESSPGYRGPAAQWADGNGNQAMSDERCTVCGSVVGARDVFCPECGATL
ncbi:MAG: CvpA family protein [Thermomicrobiales bacterium]